MKNPLRRVFLAVLVLCATLAWGQREARLLSSADTVTPPSAGPTGLAAGSKVLVTFNIPAGVTRAEYEKLLDHLAEPSSYRFESGWSGVAAGAERQAALPPFLPDAGVPPQAKPSVVAFKEGEGGDRIVKITLTGSANRTSVGRVFVAQAPEGSGWKIVVSDPVVQSGLYADYSNESPKVDQARFKPELQVDGENAVFSFQASGQLGGFKASPGGSSTRGLVIDASGTIPITVPDDTSADKRDASGQVPDFLSVTLSSYGYSRNLGLNRYGLRARTTGQAKGLEATAYAQPFMLWTPSLDGTVAAEVEFGYREGDAEWKTSTTHAPDRGHYLSRLGVVAEYAPRLGPINKNLNSGVRFFVRVRGWADGFDREDADYTFRFRHFADAELLYNISDQYRLFLRAEHGFLPPDLSRETKRVFLGIGAAF